MRIKKGLFAATVISVMLILLAIGSVAVNATAEFKLSKNSSGQWAYMADGKWKKDFTGFFTSKSSGKSFYITKGIWNTKASGFKKNWQGKWLFVKGGLWQKARTGLEKNVQGKWLFVKNGVWQESFTGFFTHPTNGKVYWIQKGVWQSGASGFKQNWQGKWLFVKGGLWQKSRTGLEKNAQSKWLYVKSGVWQKDYTGPYVITSGVNKGKIYYISNGVMTTNKETWYAEDSIHSLQIQMKGNTIGFNVDYPSRSATDLYVSSSETANGNVLYSDNQGDKVTLTFDKDRIIYKRDAGGWSDTLTFIRKATTLKWEDYIGTWYATTFDGINSIKISKLDSGFFSVEPVMVWPYEQVEKHYMVIRGNKAVIAPMDWYSSLPQVLEINFYPDVMEVTFQTTSDSDNYRHTTHLFRSRNPLQVAFGHTDGGAISSCPKCGMDTFNGSGYVFVNLSTQKTFSCSHCGYTCTPKTYLSLGYTEFGGFNVKEPVTKLSTRIIKYAKKPGVILRKEPSVGINAISNLPERAALEVQGYSSDKKWAYVYYGAGESRISYGWVEIKDLVDKISGWKGVMYDNGSR